MVCDNSDEEMLVELDMDEFKINRLWCVSDFPKVFVI
jgi:hypothetical protein